MSDQPIKLQPKRLSALALAKRSVSITVEMDIHTVLEARPNWSTKQAEDFLRRHTIPIASAMANAGVVAMAVLLKGEGQKYDC